MSVFLLYFIFIMDCHIYHFIKRLRSLPKIEREPEWLIQASSAEEASARYRFYRVCWNLSMVAEMEHAQSTLPRLYQIRRELGYIPQLSRCPSFPWTSAVAGIYDRKNGVALYKFLSEGAVGAYRVSSETVAGLWERPWTGAVRGPVSCTDLRLVAHVVCLQSRLLHGPWMYVMALSLGLSRPGLLLLLSGLPRWTLGCI